MKRTVHRSDPTDYLKTAPFPLMATPTVFFCVGDYNYGKSGRSIFGGIYTLNGIRPITRWRKLRSFFLCHEKDTMRQNIPWRALR